jgi:hypothetical protein
MDPTKQPKINNRLKMDVLSLSLDKEDLKKFCDILQERANSAADIEVGLFEKRDQTDEQYQANIETLRNSFELKITVSGKNGEELWGTIEEVFSSVNFPSEVKSLYVDSESTLRHVHNYYPHNSFKIFIDFNKPKIFDLSLMPSRSTPNESNVEVKGYDATWVNGVFSELKKFINERSSTLSIVHAHSIYDILLWVLGLPASFWVCSKLSNQIESAFSPDNTFATSALYVYAFVATLFIFRVLFHYLRWVCPLVEYRSKGNKMLAHRAVLAVLCVGWFGQFIYDIGKWLLRT